MKQLTIKPTCQIHVEYLYDPTLSLRAKGLMTQLLSYPADEPISAGVLSDLNDVCEDSIYQTLKELELKGYLTKERIRVDGRLAGTAYNLNATPMTKTAHIITIGC